MTGRPLLLLALLAAVFLYVLFFVVRGAVEAGIRRALGDELLRPTVQDLLDRGSPDRG